MAGGTLRVGLSAALHVLSGLAQTVCMQALLYSGGGDRSTLLLALPNYIGITLVYLVGRRCFRALDTLGVWAGGKTSEVNRVHASMYAAAATVSPNASGVHLGGGASGVGNGTAVQPPSPSLSAQHHLSAGQRLFHPERRKLFLLAFNEVGGFLAGLTGIAIAGSGLYQVVFSGGAVFTAVLSTIFLRKRLTPWQWIFVATITLGLMITAEQASSAAADAKPGAHAADLISGVAFVLVSCLFYSTNYVLAEHFLDHADSQNVDNDDPEQPPLSPILPPPNGLDLSMYTGGSCLVLFSVYILCHTIPNWNELVTSSIRRHHGNSKLILEQYIYITICSFLHSLSHYDVIATVGAVPIGVLNAIRAVSVFVVSSLLFCDHQASQCFNTRKGISTAVVIFGALGYSLASSSKSLQQSAPGLSGDRRGKHRRASSSSSVGNSGNLTRSLSSPFILEHSNTSSASWFLFGKRRKEAEV